MEDLSLHILDVAENSINAGAHNVSILIDEDVVHDLLTIEITDDGKGMSAEVADKGRFGEQWQHVAKTPKYTRKNCYKKEFLTRYTQKSEIKKAGGHITRIRGPISPGRKNGH